MHNDNVNYGVSCRWCVKRVAQFTMKKSLIKDGRTVVSIGQDLKAEMVTFIPRNSVLPITRTQIWTTSGDNQTRAFYTAFAGNASKTNDCIKLLECTIYGIPPRPEGEETFHDTYSIDSSGILTIESIVWSNQLTRTYTLDLNAVDVSYEQANKLYEEEMRAIQEEAERRRERAEDLARAQMEKDRWLNWTNHKLKTFQKAEQKKLLKKLADKTAKEQKMAREKFEKDMKQQKANADRQMKELQVILWITLMSGVLS